MAETGLVESSFKIPEVKKLDDDPPFLKKLGIDYPEIANEIRDRIPEWKKRVDELSEINDFGEGILNKIEYVDKEETDRLVNSVADEIREIREKNPSKPIKFIAWSTKDGSGKWFYDQVLDSLQDTSTDNISLIAPYNVMDRPDLKVNEPIYFYLDDAANSGQQIQQCINAFRVVVGDLEHSKNRDEDEMIMTKNPIDLRIRLLRITDQTKDFINKQKKYFISNDGKPFVNVDTESNPNANERMAVMDDLIAELGLKESDIQNPGAFFYGHHGRYPATFVTFRHKIQDNMPIVIVEGRLSNKAPFLISKESMKSIRNLYK